MPVVRVIVREGQDKVYHDAQASMHTPDRTLRITRNQDSIADFNPGIPSTGNTLRISARARARTPKPIRQ
jgi:hypothetical protein